MELERSLQELDESLQELKGSLQELEGSLQELDRSLHILELKGPIGYFPGVAIEQHCSYVCRYA